ncbi:hypothetical protein PG985_003581 [Apiospora marii]|uniref:uncharacterized protein n=1 Tax=Apiospora marii TaxID=335849 RepID=UPI00312D59B5
MSLINASNSDRDESVETAKESSTQPHDIIVIHGFGTKHVSHAKDVLEDWITSEARKKNLKPHCYAFDATRLFFDKDEVWKKECNNLRRWLNRLYLPGSLDPQPDVTQDARTEEGQRHDPFLRPLLFVAHGLAAWLLKDVLSAKNSNLDSRLVAILYLDGPETDSKLNIDLETYVEYIEKLTNKLYKPLVNRSSTAAKWPLLMLDTDKRFLKYLDRYQEDMEVSSMTQKSFRLWLHEDSLPPIRKCGRSGWKSIASRLTNRLSKPEFSDTLLNVFERRRPSEPPAAGSEPGFDELNTNWIDDDRSSTSRNSPRNWETFPNPQRQSLDDQQNDKQSDYVSRTHELATIYFNRSELSYAENLFSHCEKEMPDLKPPSRGQIQVLMQLMSVRISRGKYDEARKDLDKLRTLIEDTTSYDESKDSQKRVLWDWDRWEAIWNLRTGNWSRAAKILEDLKASQTQSRVEVQRDLALTYAYMGNIDQATVNIELASSTLRGRSPDAKDVRQRESVSVASTVNDMKQESIRMAQAEIHLSAGRYSLSLGEANNALNNFTRILGPKHLKTLSVANIKSLCLAYCSQYREAEGLCLTTLDLILQTLSRKHPLFIQAITAKHSWKGRRLVGSDPVLPSPSSPTGPYTLSSQHLSQPTFEPASIRASQHSSQPAFEPASIRAGIRGAGIRGTGSRASIRTNLRSRLVSIGHD